MGEVRIELCLSALLFACGRIDFAVTDGTTIDATCVADATILPSAASAALASNGASFVITRAQWLRVDACN